MIGLGPSIIAPFRGVQPPQWPFGVNYESSQAEGLVRWYSGQAFPGGITWFDLSRQNEPTQDATLDSAAMWSAGLASDIGLDLSSNGVTAGRTSIAGNNPYTWAIWIEATAAPGTANVEKVFDNGNVNESQLFVWSHNAGSSFNQSFYHRDSGGTYRKVQIASVLSVNTKYLICGTWDGVDKIRIYLNGLIEATTTGVANAITPNGSLIMSTGGTAFFPGKIYEFRAYTRMLSDAEIFELYDPRTRFDLYRSLRTREIITVDNLSLVPGTTALTLTSYAPAIFTPLIPFAANLVIKMFAPTVAISAPNPIVTGSLLQIDWNDDGDFNDTGEDVTARLISTQDLTTVRGKDQLRLLAPPMAGAFNCELDNRSRDYSAENAGSPIFSALHPGHKLRVTLTAGSILYPLFTGILDDLPQHPEFGKWTVEAPALGSLSRLRGKKITTELLESVTTDEAMTAVLDAAGWPALERSLQVGLTTLDWFWADNEDAFDVIATLLLTEGPGASVYENAVGYFIFENRHSRLTQVASTTSQFTFTDQDYIIHSQYDSGIQDIINQVEVGVTTRTEKDESVVWQYGKPLILGPSETRVVRAVASDPFKSAQVPDPDAGINAVQRLSIIGTSPQIRLSFRDEQTGDIGPASITPTAIQTALEGLGTIGSGNVSVAYALIAPDLLKFDITFQGDFAHQPIELLGVSGVGTTGKPLEVKIVDQIVGVVDDYDLLAGAISSLTLSATSGQSIEITIVADAAGAYIDKLQMRAVLVSTDSTKRFLNTVDANDSIAKYGLHPYSPSTRQEITEEQAIQLADNIIRYYKDPRPMIVFDVAGTDGTIQLQQLTRQISDRITIVDDQTGVNDDYFIERIAHRITAGPHIFTQFGCEKAGEGTIGGGGGDVIAVVGSAIVGTSQVGA